ncbi:F-box SKIP8 [Haematococcus lacustris]|uniref:F-box SKIP8 n=1 Tax=Haematococcus lacustris TaxID=44745 RepID=A0A699Z083_HAELA|nr:F-box SKIP8 [Haematococcus lacustris]
MAPSPRTKLVARFVAARERGSSKGIRASSLYLHSCSAGKATQHDGVRRHSMDVATKHVNPVFLAQIARSFMDICSQTDTLPFDRASAHRLLTCTSTMIGFRWAAHLPTAPRPTTRRTRIVRCCADDSSSIRDLRAQLEAALAREEYKDAARLRDAIQLKTMDAKLAVEEANGVFYAAFSSGNLQAKH